MKPKTNLRDVVILTAFLKNRGWIKASQISSEMGAGWDDRKIRAVANASKGRVISGQSGYKLTSEATRDEIGHAVNWLLHQANEMKSRAIAIRINQS